MVGAQKTIYKIDGIVYGRTLFSLGFNSHTHSGDASLECEQFSQILEHGKSFGNVHIGDKHFKQDYPALLHEFSKIIDRRQRIFKQ